MIFFVINWNLKKKSVYYKIGIGKLEAQNIIIQIYTHGSIRFVVWIGCTSNGSGK